MTHRTTKLIVSFVLIQTVWFVCVWSGAKGLIWPAVAAAAAGLGYHLWLASDRRQELLFTGVVLLVGLLGDSLLVQLGRLGFPAWPQADLAPLFMMALWVNFAGAFVLCLEWMRGRYLLGALFGFLGGPLAYYSGIKLAAVTLPDPLALSLLAVGLEWALAMPLLMAVREHLLRREAPAATTNQRHAEA